MDEQKKRREEGHQEKKGSRGESNSQHELMKMTHQKSETCAAYVKLENEPRMSVP